MTTEMAAPAKPSELGMLNSISLAESRAGVYLKAWADVTPDPDLRKALRFVASRETAHGEVFRQLIERKGFAVQEREDPKFEDRLRIYGDPTVADAEKIRYGRYGQDEGAIEKFFASIDERISNGSLDGLTADTLRWYVHEERDSGDVLREAYACVEARAAGNDTISSVPAGTVSADAQAIMSCMSQGFAALQQSMKELVETLSRQDKHEKSKSR